jgi:ABC-type glutathione transport system ATPase component
MEVLSMNEMEMTLWNVLLTVILAAIGFIMNEKFKALNDVTKLLNRTREEFSRDHVTRSEMREDMRHILERFDKLERKLDRVLGDKSASSE